MLMAIGETTKYKYKQFFTWPRFAKERWRTKASFQFFKCFLALINLLEVLWLLEHFEEREIPLGKLRNKPVQDSNLTN